MKITPKHYATLKLMMEPLVYHIASHRAFIIKEGRSKDIEKRLRWDLLRFAGGISFICDALYPYLNDSHIDTALKKIMAELEQADKTTTKQEETKS